MTHIDKLSPAQIETMKSTFGEAWEAETNFYIQAYGDDFVAKLFPRHDTFLAKWGIHKDTWQKVTFKAIVKKVVKALEKNGRQVDRVHVSPAFGSVYIDIRCDDEGLVVKVIRVSGHERTSCDHARPDYNIFDAASFTAAMHEIDA